MGILNLNQDSFYPNSQCHSTDEAMVMAQRMVDEGADMLDVGAESSRPGSHGVAEKEEIARVLPVVKQLSKRLRVPVSVDTAKPEVAKRALENGAALINDITGLQRDPRMAEIIARSGAGVVVMHMDETPATMQDNPVYENIIHDIINYLKKSVSIAESAGISPDCIAVDPGVGFGKTTEHNLEILGRLDSFKALGKPLMVGVSRKSFIGNLLDLPVAERLEGSLVAGMVAIMNGADIIRVHDVIETRRMVKLVQEIRKYQIRQ